MPLTLLIVAACLLAMSGCASGPEEKEKDDFFTSGSRDADQRASQRIARDEQLAASGGNGGEKKGKNSKPGAEGTAAEDEGKRTLFERLGGSDGIAAIVEDFTPRVMADPRVNWERHGVKSGGFFRQQSVTWNATVDKVARLKKHMTQFIALVTGGPAEYEGKQMEATHSDMNISNAEFDAAIGDLKATLDRLKVPTQEQKELLAIFESTRPQVVTQR